MHRAKSILLVFGPFLLTLSSLLFASYCSAATPQEEYKKMQREIKAHKEKLEKAERREHSVLTDLEKTDRDLSIVEAEVRKYRKRLKNTESQISKVEAEISLSRGGIERQREWIKRKLRTMQKNRYPGDIVLLLSGTEDISQLMKSWKSMEYITLYENRLLNTYKENLKNLDEKEKQLIVLKAELVKNGKEVKSKEEELAGKKKNKEELLASVRKEKSSYEKMLKELKESSKRLLEVIKESEKGDTYRAKGFSGLKGKLSWPVEGKIAIRYGSQNDPQFNTPVFRSGIFIQTGDDISAKAVYTGKVVFAEWFKGYGQLMIVNHGDGYHTLYGSLSEIFSKAGDIINVGQVIGRVGNSGILNAPGLYFEVRYKGKPLDPLQWLRKR
ncbi:MAG: peptidoglycan DD-metalloendopeptidase family protein [Nitrospirota bacterium]